MESSLNARYLRFTAGSRRHKGRPHPPPVAGITLIYWKVGQMRPTPEDARRVVGHTSPLVFLVELEVPQLKPSKQDAGGASAAARALEGGAPYRLVEEAYFGHKKHGAYLSLLARNDTDTPSVTVLRSPSSCCASSRLDHKDIISMPIRISTPSFQDVNVTLLGVNVDPNEPDMLLQLEELERSIDQDKDTDVMLFMGDFNIRLPAPVWSSLHPVFREGASRRRKYKAMAYSVLANSTVDELVKLMGTQDGLHNLTQADLLSIRANVSNRSKAAAKLKELMQFQRFDKVAHPTLPTYKRTPGSDNATLRTKFFEMQGKYRSDEYHEQRYINVARSDVPMLQLGWLDRMAWRLMRPTGTVAVSVDENMRVIDTPLLSDHAIVVTHVDIFAHRTTSTTTSISATSWSPSLTRDSGSGRDARSDQEKAYNEVHESSLHRSQREDQQSRPLGLHHSEDRMTPTTTTTMLPRTSAITMTSTLTTVHTDSGFVHAHRSDKKEGLYEGNATVLL